MKVLGLGDNVFDSYDNLGIAYPGGNVVYHVQAVVARGDVCG